MNFKGIFFFVFALFFAGSLAEVDLDVVSASDAAAKAYDASVEAAKTAIHAARAAQHAKEAIDSANN
ncbi:hypothetical protein FQR65_LT06776 [Abscondita terminalis]|nr:hypothetical protein FQR65_LT06776 [Abscondita terminalis]